MRIMWRSWGPGAVLALGLLLSNGTLSADDKPVVHVKAVVAEGAVRLEAQANGPFQYTTYRPSANLFVIDLSGVSAADPAGMRVVASDLVKTYRVSSYVSGQKPIVRLEILLSQGTEPRLVRTDPQDLTLLVSRTSDAASGVNPGPSPAAVVPAAGKSIEAKAPGAALEALRQVNLTQKGDQTEVNVLTSAPPNFHATHLQNPERLVLDFADSQLTAPVKHIASNLDPVREIRLAQFTPETSRVVIDLREPAHYNINTAGNRVTVSFAAAAPTDSSAPRTPTSQSSDLLTTKAAAPKSASRQIVATNPRSIPAPATVLPASFGQNSSALGTETSGALVSPTPAAMAPATSNVEKRVPATEFAAAEPVASAGRPLSQPVSSESASAEVKPAQAQAPVSTGAAKFSGEPISVNLKEVDLRDFFRLIHEISGLNVVVDPNVKGTLTIVLDDVPWDQALDIVLHNNDLDKQLDGNVLRVATKATIKKEAEDTRDLAKAQADAADVVTTTRVLSYAKATLVAVTLKKFLSTRGDVLADDRSNTLIIRDIPSTFPVLDNLLRQLDRKSQQVEIEARVVQASRSFARDIGTQFGFAFGTTNGNNIGGGTSEVGTSPVVRNFPPLPAPPIVVGAGGPTATSGSLPLSTNLGVSAPTSGLAYSFSSANFALDMIITAAENRGVGKLLSKPKVITQNNDKATIKQGTKIPVQTVVNNTVSVQFVDAVLELDVTPQITADGTVYMDVTVENDQIDQAIPRVQGIPAIDTQSAETKVTVNDGATVVIGGIIVTQQQTAIAQVPLVGSVPVLGNLFKHTTVSSTSQELLFFLTPRILPI